MADQLLNSVRDAFDGQIVRSLQRKPMDAIYSRSLQDFEGQRLAEQITTNTLAMFGVYLLPAQTCIFQFRLLS